MAKIVGKWCKCGRLCAWYGPVGQWSVKCRECNAKNAERQRMARALRWIPK